MLRKSLGNKIAAILIGVLVLVMAVGFFIVIHRQTKNEIRTMIQEAKTISETTHHTADKTVTARYENLLFLQEMAKEVSDTPGVHHLKVYDAELKTIAAKQGGDIGTVEKGTHLKRLQQVLKTGKPWEGSETDEEGHRVYSVVLPTHLEKEGDKEEVRGILEIEVSAEETIKYQDVARLLAGSIHYAVDKVNHEEFHNEVHQQKVVTDVSRIEGVDNLKIYDKDFKVVAAEDADEIGEVEKGSHQEHLQQVLKTGEPWEGYEEEVEEPGHKGHRNAVHTGHSLYSRVVPIHIEKGGGEEIAGLLEVSMNRGYWQEKVGVLRNSIIVIAAILILVLAGVVLWLSRTFVGRPLGRLAETTKKIGAGDLSQRAVVSSKDEIGELAASFNTMADSIQNKNEELQTFNEELQTTNEELKATTEELETSNEELKSSNEELEAASEEIRETQEKLVQQEKLAAVGQLASGVGHELRNPLGVMKNAVYFIKSKVGMEDEKLAKHLRIMEKEIDNSTKIISDLLGFSRTRKPAIAPNDINRVIEDALTSVEVPTNVRIAKNLDAKLPPAMIDPDQMRQVFLNLALNAIQAMNEGGMLTIETRSVNSAVRIQFKDTGGGIPKENITKLFDPFFTTKSRGIGLGLAVSHGIIERHQGKIEVQSTVGKGSTFTIVLPVTG